ncbi:MAG: hypothetical protein IPK64_13415 [bacterium]|nr:hypothetical protein [bacterium]
MAVGGTLTVRWLGSPESSPNLVPPAGHFVGHFANPVAWATDIDNSFYLLGHTFDPTVEVPDCTEGFRVLSYHLVLAKTDAAPWTADPMMTLTDGWSLDLIPPGTTCQSPPSGAYGPRYATGWYCGTSSSSWTSDVNLAGFYELVFSDLPDGGCVSADYSHVMNVVPWTFSLRVVGSRVFPAVDEVPGHCPDHRATPNMGYLWWFEFVAPGNIIMWADVTCCEPAVGTIPQKWGSLKAAWR